MQVEMDTFLNGFCGEFRSMIMVMAKKKIPANKDFYELGKLLINMRTKSVYERKSCEHAICERIVPLKVIPSDHETIFIFNVVSKSKSLPVATVKTKSHFRRFFACRDENSESGFTVTAKDGNLTSSIDVGKLDFNVMCNGVNNPKYHHVAATLNLGQIHAGEITCQIDKNKYSVEQAIELTKCVLLSAYSTITYLSEVSENELVVEEEKIS